VSKLVDRLCAKEFVTRDVTLADRRQHRITLTSIGRALVPTLTTLADENDAELFLHLSPARRELLAEALKEVVRLHRLKPPASD
jgi:DNA-binding MarR family transcriptional regulator